MDESNTSYEVKGTINSNRAIESVHLKPQQSDLSRYPLSSFKLYYALNPGTHTVKAELYSINSWGRKCKDLKFIESNTVSFVNN